MIRSSAKSQFIQLEWKSPDVDGLIDFLVREKGFRSVASHLAA